MAVETLSEFPVSFISGDTLRVTISDADFPSTLWKLSVVLQSATVHKSFAATAVGGSSTAYTLVIAAVDSAKIAAGLYTVTFIYTETSSGERQTGEEVFTVVVYGNPLGGVSKSIARQTLEAMEAAYLMLSGGSNASVNFNGQSFSTHNIKEFAEAIERQRAIVNSEDAARIGGQRSRGRVLHPL